MKTTTKPIRTHVSPTYKVGEGYPLDQQGTFQRETAKSASEGRQTCPCCLGKGHFTGDDETYISHCDMCVGTGSVPTIPEPTLMRAIVVGRHSGEIPGYEIIETRNVVWPATSTECIPVLLSLREDAKRAGWAHIILQNTPGQIAAALVLMQSHQSGEEGDGSHFWASGSPVFVIVSKPAAAGPTTTYHIRRAGDESGEDGIDDALIHFLDTALPGAHVGLDDATYIVVTVEPQRRFEFSHLERLL